MNSLENVKVGDTLLVSNGVSEYLDEVVRLTNTFVIAKAHRFAKKNGKQCGSDGLWNVWHARLATDEDIAMMRRKRMICNCENIDFSLLADSQLEQILEIANNHFKLD